MNKNILLSIASIFAISNIAYADNLNDLYNVPQPVHINIQPSGPSTPTTPTAPAPGNETPTQEAPNTGENNPPENTSNVKKLTNSEFFENISECPGGMSTVDGMNTISFSGIDDSGKCTFSITSPTGITQCQISMNDYIQYLTVAAQQNENIDNPEEQGKQVFETFMDNPMVSSNCMQQSTVPPPAPTPKQPPNHFWKVGS